MDRLIPVSKIKPKASSEIRTSRVGLGFEKLDRDLFDPEKAYDKVARTGVKWIRIQSGWARTERERGVYDFAWLDSIVDNLTSRGLIPWLCLCYGNGLYDEDAAKRFAGVGTPPVRSDDAKQGWRNYVSAVATRYRGKIPLYEVWNEPDGIWCWKHGVNPAEYAQFTDDTAKAIKAIDPDAKVAGGSVCLRSISFVNDALAAGMGESIDYITFHEYTHAEEYVFERVQSIRALCDIYAPHVKIIQGESGSQSKRGGRGALRDGAWTEERQAKQLARHTIADLMTEVEFASFFTVVDMLEALSGNRSWLEYAYFGILRADYGETGLSVGEYTEKPSYYVLQNIASLFSGEYEVKPLPMIVKAREPSPGIYEDDIAYRTLISNGFIREGGEAWVYWNPTNIMTTSYEGTVSAQVYSRYDKLRIADVMSGIIYELPPEMAKRSETGVWELSHIPVKDTPLVLMFGDFEV